MILNLVAIIFLKRSVVMHKMINFVESINNSFIPYFVLENSTTLRPNSTWKDVVPNNLSLCRSHLSSASIINATATTLNMMGDKSKPWQEWRKLTKFHYLWQLCSIVGFAYTVCTWCGVRVPAARMEFKPSI